MSKQLILDKALESFSEDGYSGTTLRSIADKAGMKAPSIYAHFPSKEKLFLAVYDRAYRTHEEFFEQLSGVSADATPLERLHRVLIGVGIFYHERPDLVNFHLHCLAAPPVVGISLKSVFMSSDKALSALIINAYTDGCADGSFESGDPEAFCAFFLTLMDGAFLQLKHYSPDEARRRLELTWNQVHTLLTSAQEAPHDRDPDRAGQV